MTKLNKAIELLGAVFTRNGQVYCSAADTSQGTKHLWGLLEALGYVTKHTKSGRGLMGHPFSYAISETGRNFMNTKQQLIDERHGIARFVRDTNNATGGGDTGWEWDADNRVLTIQNDDGSTSTMTGQAIADVCKSDSRLDRLRTP